MIQPTADEIPTILLVDDDRRNIESLSNYFMLSKFHIIVAQDGEEALRTVKTVQPDLILLDVVMPGINGFETCQQLKANEATRDIPVIFMTGLRELKTKIEAFQAGGVDYLSKPFSYEEVMARVNVHLALRKLQRQLQQQNDELQTLNANKDQFLSIIVNDLKKPFAEIFVAAERIKQQLHQKQQEPVKQSIKSLQDAVQNYHALLENLLLWARVQQRLIEYAPQPLELPHLVVRNIALFTANAVKKQIALKNSMPPQLRISADLTMIDTVIHNLLSNAIKFTRPGGSVKISATDDEDTVTLVVSDTGIGIPPDRLEHLFQIGAKHQRVGTADEKGTGLGLILCRAFVQQHGGTITVESTIEQGSTFWVTLPKIANLPGDRTEA
jgi:signal transduction histidine kinase